MNSLPQLHHHHHHRTEAYMDKLLALKMFVASVDAKGFSAAARQLNIATSSVTRMIDSLEAELGAVLLNRSTRQVTVSEAGATYYLRARQILEDMAEADAQINDRGELAAGQLRVSLPVEFGRRCIVPYLGRLMQNHPQLELDITLTDSIVDLVSERIDLSIRLGSAAPMDGVVSRHLGNFQRFVVASPAYLAATGLPESPQDLTGLSCLRFNYSSAQQIWNFVRDGEELRVPVSGRVKSNNTEVLREAALAGVGLALLPDWLVDGDIVSGQLTRLFEPWAITPNNAIPAISALYLPNHRGSKRVNAFIEFLEEVMLLRPV
jgi:DNA-binding transcriptional LysR family regulator